MDRTNIIVFDCETTGVERDDYITCMASIETSVLGNQKIKQWHSGLGMPMHSDVAIKFINYLWDLTLNKHYTIISFNGVSFDFKFIAKLLKHRPIELERCETLALQSEDIMLDFTTEHGYFAGMQSFADGCKVKGKTNTGAWAVTAWQTGNQKDQEAVIEYCIDDVRVLTAIVNYRHKRGKLYRTTKAGKRSLWVPMSPTFRKAYECIQTFELNPVVPDWMKKGSAPNIKDMWGWI